jgi:predicted homoserine dehydrogenase-like protein
MLGKKLKGIVKIGIAGSVDTDTGQRTTTLAAQLQSIPEIDIKAIFNPKRAEAEKVLELAGLSSGEERFCTDSVETFFSCGFDAVLVTEMDSETAARIVTTSLENKIPVINLNAVTEAALGYLFKAKAEEHGSIYSVGAGDEPAATLELLEFCEKLNLTVICAGKGKNNPMNIHAVPDDLMAAGKEKNVNPQSLASFVDGTKTMLEMSILSNATGYPIDIPGMHGPNVNVDDLISTFVSKDQGGLLSRIPVIDYGIGDIAPGVFVVFTTEQESIIRELQYLKMKGGPNFVLYKPYHLGNIEAPLSIYDVLCDNRPSLVIKDGYVTSVVTKAKKDLHSGDVLDTSGGYGFYGFAVSAGDALKKDYVPLCLVEKSTVKRDIAKDEIIRFDDIEIDTRSFLWKLWQEQESLL